MTLGKSIAVRILKTAAVCTTMLAAVFQTTAAGSDFAAFEERMRQQEALTIAPYYTAEPVTIVSVQTAFDDKTATEIIYIKNDIAHTPESTPEPEETAPEFIWPVFGEISSPFGPRSIEVGSSNHKGIDIAAPGGNEICAAKSGTVSYAQFNTGGYGNLVIIDHDGEKSTYYAHCSEILVSPGQYVQQGQVIALVGSTGNSTGNHCHFEVRLDDVPQDPMKYLA